MSLIQKEQPPQPSLGELLDLSESLPPQPAPSPLDHAQGVELLEELDACAVVRNRLRIAADIVDEYAGFPLAVEGETLIVAPSYAFAHIYNKAPAPDTEEKDDLKVRNVFWSEARRTTVYVYEKEGRVKHVKSFQETQLSKQLRTLGCSPVWGIEQEAKAITLLGTLIKHHQFKQYMLTGSFLERSKRSGLTYMFRRLRPTVVIEARANDAFICRVLAALCLHPIGYYEDSWAGAMCPTDDVIAHLMLMRGDEHLYWKRSTQHHPSRPEAGL